MAKRIAEQMELFEPVERGFQEGGLKDEGGKTDPVSGNEVPPGSLREEVRDDIPAQLSEGEFVFPADVVRYIGLETLMRMRQEAKQGLAQMEAMGQMGNSEEATMPDDLPFDMYDLEVEDDGLEMQTGGMVPTPMSTAMGATTTGGSYNPATNQFQPFANMGLTQPQPLGTAFTPPTAASAAYSPRLGGTLFTPTTPEVQYQQPTLYGTTGFGPEGVEFEDVTYVNEQGQILNFKRNKQTGQLFDLSGNPTVVPEGYTEQAKEEEQVETTPTTGTGVQTATVRDDGGREDASPTGTTTAFGGSLDSKGRVSGGFRADISFDNVGNIRGTAINAGLSGLGQLLGKPSSFSLPNDAIATLTNVEPIRPAGVYAGKPEVYTASFTMKGKTYNDLFTDKTVTSRKEMEEIINYMEEKYGKGLNNKDNTYDLDIIRDVMTAEKAVKASGKARAAEAIGNVARDAGLVGKDITDADVAAAKAAAAAAPDRDPDTSGDQGDRSDSAPDRGMSGQGDVGFGSGTDCLTENMKVKLNGVIDFVTNIKVGDIIDGSVVKEVLHKHMRSGYFVINNELEITNDHPVWAKSGGLGKADWTRPEQLVVGDTISGVKVTSLNYIDRMTPTVSIVIDGDSFDVYTEGNTYTVHGRYREVRQEAA